MVLPIHIYGFDQIKKINNIACETPFEIWLSSHNVTLNARSLLSLYCLMNKDVFVVAEDNVDPNKFAKVVSKMII